MKIVFTRHAQRRLKERGIIPDQVYEALGTPDELFIDKETGYIVAVSYRYRLFLVLDLDADTIKVVTVVVSSGLRSLVKKRVAAGRWSPWRGSLGS